MILRSNTIVIKLSIHQNIRKVCSLWMFLRIIGHMKYCGLQMSLLTSQTFSIKLDIKTKECIWHTHRLRWSRLYRSVTYLAFSISQCMFVFIILMDWKPWNGKKTDREWDGRRYRTTQKGRKKVQLTFFSLSLARAHTHRQIIWVIQCITCQVILATRFVLWWKWYAHFINSIFVLLFNVYLCSSLWI